MLFKNLKQVFNLIFQPIYYIRRPLQVYTSRDYSIFIWFWWRFFLTKIIQLSGLLDSANLELYISDSRRAPTPPSPTPPPANTEYCWTRRWGTIFHAIKSFLLGRKKEWLRYVIVCEDVSVCKWGSLWNVCVREAEYSRYVSVWMLVWGEGVQVN